MDLVAGEDDARARATLVEMQSRISLGPHRALGVDEGATREQIRAAFLALTKTFHPARFGRMAVDVQKLSNEVFLGIKGAHETMLKAMGLSSRAPTNSAPPGRFARSASPPPDRATTGKMPPLTPTPRSATPSFGVTIVAPGRVTANIPTTRLGPASTVVSDDDPDFKKALQLIASRQWAEAGQLFMKLRGRDNSSKRFRALHCYTRAREAEAAGQRAAAVQELERALQFEPDLPEAKSALAELHRRP
jgi:hypothetical protein